MDKRDFQTDLTKYFSDHILLYASLATFAGAWLIFDQELIGGISLVLIGLLFLTARYGLQISFQKKTYRKFAQIIGIKTGEHIPFNTIDYLFIISGKRSQTMNYKSLSATISETEFEFHE